MDLNLIQNQALSVFIRPSCQLVLLSGHVEGVEVKGKALVYSILPASSLALPNSNRFGFTLVQWEPGH